jgi:hypothetical protein
MKRSWWIAFVFACGGKAETKQETPGSAATVVPADAAVAEKSAKPPKQKPKPTRAQLDELKKRMRAGMALQKASKWAESVPEFEAALVAVPDDQRALAELGWSAMHAGDFTKARKADEQAIRVAVDKNVKAAGLYNLGQVQEKTGDKPGAQKSYQESLTLRPHPVVEKALVALGAKPGVSVPFCAAGAKPCDCIFEHAFDENQQGTAATCVEAKTPAIPVKTFKLYTVASEAYFGSKWTYVLDEANQLVDIVDGEAERGRMFEKTTLDKAEVKTIAGHWVLWLETTNRTDVTYVMDDDMVGEEWLAKQVTICVIGDAKTATRCPLRDVPLLQKVDKGKPVETHLEVKIADDGIATVKLLKGPSDAQIGKLVGPHKLW